MAATSTRELVDPGLLSELQGKVDDQFRISPWALRFEKEIEARFQQDYLTTLLLRIRIAIILGAALYSLFYILDLYFVPDLSDTIFKIRFWIVGPYILGLSIVSFTPLYRRYQQFLNFIGILLAGGGIIVMTLLRPEYTFSYYAGIFMVLIYGYNLMGLRFYWATLSGWILVIAYIAGIELMTEIPFQRALSNYFFLTGSNLLLMFGAYFIEVLRRKDFYLRLKLSENQNRIQEMNAELEKIVTNRTADLVDEVAERKLAQKVTQKALQEKEVLLKEVYHRTKNNMNTIISLLNLQAYEQQSRPNDGVFQQLADRIYSMSMVHELLYQSENLSTINLNNYIQKLHAKLSYSLLPVPSAVKLALDGDEIQIGLEQAVPLGLALNEILTNALKHGFAGGRAGKIAIRLAQLDQGKVQLKIFNDGQPPETPIDIESADTLGLRLINILLRDQLGAEIEVTTAEGVSYQISMELPQDKIPLAE